jgi:hypothetical protein
VVVGGTLSLEWPLWMVGRQHHLGRAEKCDLCNQFLHSAQWPYSEEETEALSGPGASQSWSMSDPEAEPRRKPALNREGSPFPLS